MFLIQLSVGHLVCFHVLVIITSAAVNFGVHVSFHIFVFSGCICRSGIARAGDSSIFSFLSDLHTVFCINLHSNPE